MNLYLRRPATRQDPQDEFVEEEFELAARHWLPALLHYAGMLAVAWTLLWLSLA